MFGRELSPALFVMVAVIEVTVVGGEDDVVEEDRGIVEDDVGVAGAEF
jgi:hypothetical protein